MIIEQLEEKIVPAGVVAISYSPVGGLTISSTDGLDNAIAITGGGGQLSISDGLPGGTTLFSVNNAAAVAAPVITLSAGLSSATINLGAGSDTIAINNVSFASNLTVIDDLGGNDIALLSNVTSLFVNLNLGTGNDTVQFSGAQINSGSVLGGTMTVALGDGDNAFTIDNTVALTANAGMTVSAGAGVNSFNLTPNTLAVSGALTITNTGLVGNAQTVNLSPVLTGTVSGALSLTGTNGDHTFTVQAGTSFTTGGSMSVTAVSASGNDTLNVANVSGGSAATVNLGAGTNAFNHTSGGFASTAFTYGTAVGSTGSDTLNFNGTSFATTGNNGFTLNLGEGTNTANFNSGTFAFGGGAASIGGGSSQDTVSVLGAVTSISTPGALNFNLGAGLNSATLAAASLNTGAVSYTGTTGNDTFALTGTNTTVSSLSVTTGDGQNSVGINTNFLTVGSGLTINNTGSAGLAQSINVSAQTGSIAGAVSLTNTNGNATMSVQGGTSLAIGGTLAVTAGTGNDSLDVANLSIGTAATVNLGAGTNAFNHTSGGFASTAFTYGTAVGSTGSDTLNFNGTSFATTGSNGFTLNLGEGTNTANFNSGTFAFGGGAASIVGGSGQDTVSMLGAVTSISTPGALNINLGAGLNSATLPAASLNTGAVSYTGTTGNDTFALTGTNVTLTGTLNVTTGAGANTVNIAATNAMNLGAVTIDNTGTAGQAQNITVTAGTGNVGALAITSSNGDSTLSLGGTTSFNLASTLNITTGAGNDTLALQSISVPDANILMGAGNNSVVATGAISAGTFTYGPALSSPGGADNDSLQFNGTSFATTGNNGFTLNLGAGTNTVGFNSGTFALGDGTNNIKGGAAQDTVSVGAGASFVSTGALSLDLGDGSNSITIAGSAFTAGPLTYVGTNGSDTFALTSTAVTINGALSVTTGSGSNTINVVADTLSSGAITVTNTGTVGQVQTINVTAATSANVTGALTITNTNGIGTISVGGLPASTSFALTAGLAITSGSGDDTLTLGRITSTTASIDLKAGNNTVDTTGAISTGAFTYGSGVVGTGNDILTFNNNLNANATTFHLGAGNNDLTFNQAVVLGGSLIVNAGAGTDAVAINNTFAVTGAATFNVDAGQNTLMVNSSNLTVTGALAYTGGAGSDSITLEGAAANLGSLNVNAGNGQNELALWSAATTLTTSLQYTGGAGTDTVEIGDFETGGTAVTIGTLANVQMGDGANALGVQGATIGGAFTANSTLTRRLTADVVRVYESSITGATNITMGSGSSIVDLQSVTMGAVNISTGAGSDIVLLDNISSILGVSTFNGAFSVNLGTGDDFLYAGSSPNLTDASNVFNSSISIDGGTGTDTALILDPTSPPGSTRNNTFASTKVLTNVEVLG